MSDSFMKEKQEQIHIDKKNPLYCASYVQTWENYRKMNEELYKQKLWQLVASRFAILMIVGTAFMSAEKLNFLGWICYCAAIMLIVGLPLIWRYNLRAQYRSANIGSDNEWDYAFFKDSFKLDSNSTTVVRKYSDLYRIVEGKEYIYLLTEKNHAFPVPRDHGELDKFLLGLGKQREKDKILPILCCFFVISGTLTAFFGITELRLPNQWLLQTWAYVICATVPFIWMITIVLTAVSWNLYRIPYVQKKSVRIILRLLSCILCVSIILSLGFLDFLFMLGRYPVKQNDNGTYTEHVDDSYSPFNYYLYQPEGPFFLKYLRPMTDSRDTDPTISESEWYRRLLSDGVRDKGLDPEYSNDGDGKLDENRDLGNAGSHKNPDGSDINSPDSKSKQIRNGALKIFDEYFAAQGLTFRESYTAKGNTYFVLSESDSDITYLQYDRDSKNGKCGLYVLFKLSKTSDGKMSMDDAKMQNTYAYEYRTGSIAESGKKGWSDTGSEEYRKITGEP